MACPACLVLPGYPNLRRHVRLMPATLEYASSAPKPLAYPRLANHHYLPSNTPDYLRLILSAKVYDIIKETPLVRASSLSAKLGNDIWLKREDAHEVFSFKIRGAYNFMASLNDDERWKGVVTCSAGKHRFRALPSIGVHLHTRTADLSSQAIMRKASPCLARVWAFHAPS